MAKLSTTIAALTVAVAALTNAPVSAQSAVSPAASVSCTATKWDGCSFEQRLASVSAFCDVSGVPLKDNDKARLAKASREDFLATLGCTDKAPAVATRQPEPPDTDVDETDAQPKRVAYTTRRPPAANSGLDRDLAARALQVLGPAPTQNHSFAGVKRRAEPAPRGCTRTARRVQGGTYYRVVCN